MVISPVSKIAPRPTQENTLSWLVFDEVPDAVTERQRQSHEHCDVRSQMPGLAAILTQIAEDQRRDQHVDENVNQRVLFFLSSGAHRWGIVGAAAGAGKCRSGGSFKFSVFSFQTGRLLCSCWCGELKLLGWVGYG